jgi:hypothetical protein
VQGKLLQLTPREAKLIAYGRRLDQNKRHRVTIIYRGTEPWEIREHIRACCINLPRKSSKMLR